MLPTQNANVVIRHYRYNQAKKLGKGATGTVYLGIDTRTNLQVAIKVINMKEINNEVKRYLLMTEQNALVGLKHPNIIRCLDVIKETSECHFITEFCPEGTLHDFIKQRGKISETEALQIFRQIVSACITMHANKVTHRDLKPSNILMVDGHPKITDFGFCDIVGSVKPKMFYNVGSPSYMSPEAYMDNMYGEKSDVWAVGGILYEMLVGSTIDKGRKITQLYNHLKIGKQFIPNGISPLSKTILTQCFKYDPRQRISFQALERLLDSALGPMQQQQSSIAHQSNTVSIQQTAINQPQSSPSTIQTLPQQLISPPTQQPLKVTITNPIIEPNLSVSVPQLPLQTSVQPPTNYPPQTRQPVASVGNQTLKPNQLHQPHVNNQHSKSPMNTARNNRNLFPLGPLNNEMKGSIVDEDSWLASQLRQKELSKQTKSSSKLPDVPVIQSTGVLPMSPAVNLQPPQQPTLQSMLVSPTTVTQPLPSRNRSPDIITSKMPIPIVPNRTLMPTQYMKTPTFYR